MGKDKKIKKIDEFIDDTIIDFFNELYPLKKGEAHTWLCPLMTDLKMGIEDIIHSKSN